MAAILNITRFQTATYVFLEAENIPKISGQVACFLQKVPTGLYICTLAAALTVISNEISHSMQYKKSTALLVYISTLTGLSIDLIGGGGGLAQSLYSILRR